MHELAVTEGLLEVALRHAEGAGAVRVTDLHLVIGRLSSIVDDSVQFYWDFVSRGTPADGARLHFRRVPVEMHCAGCDARYRPEGDDLSCPSCGGTSVRVVAGEEFHLEAIDVETAEDVAARAPGSPGGPGLDPATGRPDDPAPLGDAGEGGVP
jgi:hydrogenase nickel incorporation protein HypA/HybF